MPPRDESMQDEVGIAKAMAEHTAQDKLKVESNSLRLMIARILKKRYKRFQTLSVLEVGPGPTNYVARALSGKFSSYKSLELSPSTAALHSRYLQELPAETASRCTSEIGNTFATKLPEESADLVIACYHDPLLSGTCASIEEALDELARVLKTGGELMIAPWLFTDEKYPGTVWYTGRNTPVPQPWETVRLRYPTSLLLKHFDGVYEERADDMFGHLVVLRKRAAQPNNDATVTKDSAKTESLSVLAQPGRLKRLARSIVGVFSDGK